MALNQHNAAELGGEWGCGMTKEAEERVGRAGLITELDG
jgi:hypothetical protein